MLSNFWGPVIVLNLIMFMAVYTVKVLAVTLGIVTVKTDFVTVETFWHFIEY